ncbi:MAG: hypothetical protein V4662_08885 [Verrucomicrobiota bacterium]
MKPHRIFFSAHDPRNAVLAEWAGTLACVEWLVILAYLEMMPLGHYNPPLPFQLAAMTACTMLMLMGWRGIISGHVKRMGSLVLFATNVFLVLFSLFISLRYWFKENYV